MGLILLLFFFCSTRTLADPVIRGLANTARMFRAGSSGFSTLALALAFAFPFSFTLSFAFWVGSWLRSSGRWLDVRWLVVVHSGRTIPLIIVIMQIFNPVIILFGIVNGLFNIL